MIALLLLGAGCVESPRSVADVEISSLDAKQWGCGCGSPGDLVSYTSAVYLPASELDLLWSEWQDLNEALGYIETEATYQITPGYGVDLYEVTYLTRDVDDGDGVLECAEIVEATGVIAIPRRSGRLGVVTYFRGTEVGQGAVLSEELDPNVTFDGQTPLVGAAGEGGFIFVAPDGPGFGESEIPRDRYFVKEVWAAHGSDLLDAAEDIQAYRSKRKAGKVFSWGFSAGGQAATAFTELRQSESRPVTATAIQEGVFDVLAWHQGTFSEDGNPFLRIYESDMALTVFQVTSIQGAPVRPSISDIWKSPYDGLVESMFSGDYFYWDFFVENGQPLLTYDAADLFQEAFLDTAFDVGDSYRTFVEAQGVESVCPLTAFQIFHSDSDEEVPVTHADEFVVNATSCGASVSRIITSPGLRHLGQWHADIDDVVGYFQGF